MSDTWRLRAIAATRGNQTLLGTILIAVLQKSILHNPPRFGRQCVITRDGQVFAPYQGKDLKFNSAAFVCTADELRDGFRDLADKLKLNDADRAEMFGELRKWVQKDFRAEAPRLE